MSLDPVFPSEFESDEEPLVAFFSEDISFSLPNEETVISWIEQVVIREECELIGLQIVFCSDPYLLDMNVAHLNHDFFTDIITFPYQRPPGIEGDLFISIDRVKDNAIQLQQSFERELHRVIIHGVLHLCGHNDKSDEDAAAMRLLEDAALLLHPAFSE
ncbi:MAG: rRNA maturation RNase YbeY [Saprospiraceae bacterium]|nr:rRNA maturation RNase YbeY [Saprospiraceae bacterium]